MSGSSREAEDDSEEDTPQNNTNASGAARAPECSPERSGAISGGFCSSRSTGSTTPGAAGTTGGVTESIETSADGATVEDSRAGKRKGAASRTGSSSPTNGKGRGMSGGRGRGAGGGGGGTGSKWSLKALRRRLAEMGVDVPALWENIHDLCIKTLIAIEAQVKSRRASSISVLTANVYLVTHDRENQYHIFIASPKCVPQI